MWRGGDLSSSYSVGSRAHSQAQQVSCSPEPGCLPAESGHGPEEAFLKSVVFMPHSKREMMLSSPSLLGISSDKVLILLMQK